MSSANAQPQGRPQSAEKVPGRKPIGKRPNGTARGPRASAPVPAFFANSQKFSSLQAEEKRQTVKLSETVREVKPEWQPDQIVEFCQRNQFDADAVQSALDNAFEDAKHTGEAGGDWETIKPRRKPETKKKENRNPESDQNGAVSGDGANARGRGRGRGAGRGGAFSAGTTRGGRGRGRGGRGGGGASLQAQTKPERSETEAAPEVAAQPAAAPQPTYLEALTQKKAKEEAERKRQAQLQREREEQERREAAEQQARREAEELARRQAAEEEAKRAAAEQEERERKQQQELQQSMAKLAVTPKHVPAVKSPQAQSNVAVETSADTASTAAPVQNKPEPIGKRATKSAWRPKAEKAPSPKEEPAVEQQAQQQAPQQPQVVEEPQPVAQYTPAHADFAAQASEPSIAVSQVVPQQSQPVQAQQASVPSMYQPDPSMYQFNPQMPYFNVSVANDAQQQASQAYAASGSAVDVDASRGFNAQGNAGDSANAKLGQHQAGADNMQSGGQHGMNQMGMLGMGGVQNIAGQGAAQHSARPVGYEQMPMDSMYNPAYGQYNPGYPMMQGYGFDEATGMYYDQSSYYPMQPGAGRKPAGPMPRAGPTRGPAGFRGQQAAANMQLPQQPQSQGAKDVNKQQPSQLQQVPNAQMQGGANGPVMVDGGMGYDKNRGPRGAQNNRGNGAVPFGNANKPFNGQAAGVQPGNKPGNFAKNGAPANPGGNSAFKQPARGGAANAGAYGKKPAYPNQAQPAYGQYGMAPMPGNPNYYMPPGYPPYMGQFYPQPGAFPPGFNARGPYPYQAAPHNAAYGQYPPQAQYGGPQSPVNTYDDQQQQQYDYSKGGYDQGMEQYQQWQGQYPQGMGDDMGAAQEPVSPSHDPNKNMNAGVAAPPMADDHLQGPAAAGTGMRYAQYGGRQAQVQPSYGPPMGGQQASNGAHMSYSAVQQSQYPQAPAAQQQAYPQQQSFDNTWN